VADRILTAATALVAAHPGTAWPCCEFTARTVRDALDLPYPDGSRWWRAMNVWDPAEPWSAPEAMEEATGEPSWDAGVSPPWLVGRWYICQGWRRLSGPDGTVGPGDTGHTWLWYATSPTHGVVLDSSRSRGPRLGGVAYTGIRDSRIPNGRPWAERVAAYPAGVAVALLPGAP
jgi:hypothetical protein